LLDVPATHPAAHRPVIACALRATQHVQVQYADADLAVDRMAEGADQQCRAATSVGIGGAADVPPEPAVRLVAEQLGQRRPAPPGAELNAADPVGGLSAMPGCADGEVLDAVSIQVSRGNHHPSEQLARLPPRPAP